MKKLNEILFMSLFLGFITGLLPFAWLALYEVHPVIAMIVVSPVLIKLGKEVTRDVKNYYR